MKFRITALTTLFFLLLATPALACVGRKLTIASLDSPNADLLCQMLSVLINQRTGTSVSVIHYKKQQNMYNDVKRGKVNILVEDSIGAEHLLGKTISGNSQSIYLALKQEYKKKFGLILLYAFGNIPAENGRQQHFYMPIITTNILRNYPALPRVIKKLAGVAEDKTYPQLLKAVESGQKPTTAAMDFLRRKRFI